jgi:hypothetical protein
MLSNTLHTRTQITEQIHRKAQGNPFVTQEMVQSLMEFVDVGDNNERTCVVCARV